jgi:hypothetical protein
MLSLTKLVLNMKKEIDTNAHTTGLNDMKHSHTPPPTLPPIKGLDAEIIQHVFSALQPLSLEGWYQQPGLGVNLNSVNNVKFLQPLNKPKF